MEQLIFKFLFFNYIVIMCIIDIYASDKYKKNKEITIIILGLSYPIFVYYFYQMLTFSNPNAGLADLLFVIVMLVLAPIGIFHGRKNNNHP
ncbi:hypothetical protein [Psychrobacter sp. I-STPA10]|uniref:hypothetical protein n=1 Tax=Psychrobacter sp. I-STPA10 TaxID=2585769 RepID=UPI001E490E27|nr:hypothetical protein [Psychrobacter sp. I-STPA10]